VAQAVSADHCPDKFATFNDLIARNSLRRHIIDFSDDWKLS